MVLKSAIPSFIRSTKDHVFHRSQMQAFTELMTGKRDLKSLYAHCAAVGAGVGAAGVVWSTGEDFSSAGV